MEQKVIEKTFIYDNKVSEYVLKVIIDEEELRGKSGKLRINLQWNTTDDLDLHVIDPCGNEIFFNKKEQICRGKKGELDVDANASDEDLTENPQENIFWPEPPDGKYKVAVVLYKKRTSLDRIPFNVTIILGDTQQNFSGTISREKEVVVVTEFDI